MSITRDAVLQVLAFLFPPACLACDRVEGVTSLALGLCSRCHGRLEILETAGDLSKRDSSAALDALLSRWSYEPPFDAVIHGLKFGRLEFLGRDLADGLHDLLEDVAWEIDVVVPIPLHWHRRLARGYNQAEAIAEPIARRLSLPLVKALRRRRPTKPQAKLSRAQRETNLRLAFAPVRHRCARIAGQRLLLVDDVVTTGATVEAAGRCLRDHGARSVVALAAGRTPDPGGHRRSTDRYGENKRFLTKLF